MSRIAKMFDSLFHFPGFVDSPSNWVLPEREIYDNFEEENENDQIE